MGQYWKIVNIDKAVELKNDRGLKLWEILVNGEPGQLVALLTLDQSLGNFRIPGHLVAACKAKCGPSAFTSLPQEIIDIITSFLEPEASDVVCLALSCSYFFRLSALQVRKALIADSAPWAGDRLVIVGDYAEGIPPGITINVSEDGDRSGWESDEDDAESSFSRRNPLYNLPDGEVGLNRHALKANIQERISGDSACDVVDDIGLFHRLSCLVTTGKPDGAIVAYHKTSDAILRNLTAKQYVRDDALAASDYGYSLGEVICTRTQWTADTSGTVGLGCEGEWVGHRFDIVHLQAEEITSKLSGWEDVSDLAVECLKKGTNRYRKRRDETR